MKKTVIFAIFIITCHAAHVDLDKRSQIEFAQKRLSMMKSKLTDLIAQMTTIEKAISSMPKESSSPAFQSLINRLNQLNNAILNLKNQATITENSIVALYKK